MGTSSDSIEKFLRILTETKEPAYDVETTGLDWKRDKCIGYSVSDGKDSVYIPVRHTGGGNVDNPSHFEDAVNIRIQQHTGSIVGHNIKFDAHFSQNQCINLGDKVVDTMVMEALLDENRRSYSLENVANSYDIAPKKGKLLYDHISAKFGCKPDRSAMGHYHRLSGNDALAVEYAAGDTLTTYQLYQAQKKQLYAQNLDMVASMENELSYILQKMERRGVIVDPDEAERIKYQVDEMYEEAFAQLPAIVTDDGDYQTINVRSGKDLKEYFEYCEIDDWPMTLPTARFPEGQPSFNAKYLATTEEGRHILNVRKLAHLKSSFLDVLDSHVFKGRIHTTFNQTRGETHGTRSGRLSSSYPNMQQVPKRDEQLGKIYRRIFVPLRDYILVEYDYSQAEPRLYSHYSGEPTLINGYNATPYIDMHTIAAQYMGVTRAVAKNLNLGIMYTMGAEKLSIQLGISYDDALAILRKWHKTFPKVSSFTKQASKVAEDRGYVKTILGRRSRFDNPRFSYRAANRIVQGGSADILKYKMVQIDRYLRFTKQEEVCQMLLNIHDSILFMIQKDHLDLIEKLKVILEEVNVPPFSLKVPFVADCKQGSNWSEATYGNV